MKKKIALLLIGSVFLGGMPFISVKAENSNQITEKMITEETTTEVPEREEPVIKETITEEQEQDEPVMEEVPQEEEKQQEDNMEGQNDESEEAEDKQIKSRQVVNIDQGWDFTINDSTAEGWGIPDGKTSGTVDLPHCWEYVHPSKSYIPQFNQKTVTYTKTVDISEMKNKNLFLKFYGSSRNTQVFIDGEEVGTHIGGYSAFVFDISDKAEGKDQITITANVTNLDTTSIPINVDYTQWAGIYRDVELISTDDQYIATEDYGNDGIYIDYSVQKNKAFVKLKTELSNKAGMAENLKLVTEIQDADGNSICRDERTVTVEAESIAAGVETNYCIPFVHLWNGTEDPYLYTMKVELYDELGENLLDMVSKKFGVRTYEIKNGRFYLNGNRYEIHGVGLHQDRENYGNAVPKELKKQDMDLMQEMGVNAIRTSHYPHDQYVYDQADERGWIVYAEIPYYLLLSNSESYQTSINEQLKEMIHQGYNHPSIMMWGIQNEVYQSDQFAQFGNEFKVDKETLVAFNKGLAELAQREDKSRYIVQAEIDWTSANEAAAEWSRDGKVDYSGVNLYIGFKSDVSNGGEKGRKKITDILNKKIDDYKKIYQTDSLMITEYGAGANINQHTSIDENFSWKGSDESGAVHYEEYQSYLVEIYYKLIQDRGDIPLSFVWNMFDFSCYRNEGSVPRTNTKGLICYDHETKKDAFYFYKANWNKTEKFVYLTSKRYSERKKRTDEIKAYSNCDKVELFVNNKSIGYGEKQQSGVFVWENVTLDKDKDNSIKVVGTADGKEYIDEVSDIDITTSITYQAHVQDKGWMDEVSDGAVAGTTGEAKQMEAVKVRISNGDCEGSIEYRTHVQNKGWLDWVKDGELSGTSGEALQMETIQLKLTGEIEEKYDVYYRAHVENVGWLDWAKNGEAAGTAGYGYQMEALEIRLVNKEMGAPGKTDMPMKQRMIEYQTHVEESGDGNWIYDGNLSGSVGKAKRLEGIRINILSIPNVNVKYCTHVQDIGWQREKENGQLAGTKGKAKRLEAIKIYLSGKDADKYDIYYQVHAQDYGWLDWAKNGEAAGTEGLSKRLEAIRIVVLNRGEVAPGNTDRTFVKKVEK